MRSGLKLLAGAMIAAAAFITAADARTVRWARSVDAQTLDPMSANIGPTSNLAHQIYEPLVIRGYDGKLVATLATEWRILPDDPTVWEFKLRQGVKFHDGSDFTADDAIFSFERARKPTSDYRGLLTSIDSVTKVDAHTIRIKTKAPNPLLVENLTNIFMMCQGLGGERTTPLDSAEHPRAPGERRDAQCHGHRRRSRSISREPDVRTVDAAVPGLLGHRASSRCRSPS